MAATSFWSEIRSPSAVRSRHSTISASATAPRCWTADRYTVARHLGYDVRLYDGSYIDWSRTEYPVER